VAKGNASDYFSIDPGLLTQGSPLPCNLYILLPLNGRIILYKKAGEIFENTPVMLKAFHIANSEKAAFDAYLEEKEEPALLTAPKVPQKKSEEERTEPAAEKAPEESAPELVATPPVQEAKEPAAEYAKTEFEGEAPAAADTLNLDATPPPVRHGAPAPEKKSDAVQGEKKPEAAREEKKGPEAPAEKAAVEPPPIFEPPRPAEEMMADLLGPEPEKSKTMQEARKMVRQILEGPPGSATELAGLAESGIAEHATTVAVYAALIAMGLHKGDLFFLQDIIVAGLLHDIGVTQTPLELVAVPEMKRSKAQQARFEEHVDAGLKLTSDLGYTPNPRVTMIISQHHEKFDGTGYPKRLDGFGIEDSAQVLKFADMLDTIAHGRHDGKPRAVPDALSRLAEIERSSTFPVHFNPDLLKKIRAWFIAAAGEDHMAEAKAKVDETKQRMLKAG
jgi:putative nucleotidyltransferase with HDIG domain